MWGAAATSVARSPGADGNSSPPFASHRRYLPARFRHALPASALPARSGALPGRPAPAPHLRAPLPRHARRLPRRRRALRPAAPGAGRQPAALRHGRVHRPSPRHPPASPTAAPTSWCWASGASSLAPAARRPSARTWSAMVEHVRGPAPTRRCRPESLRGAPRRRDDLPRRHGNARRRRATAPLADDAAALSFHVAAAVDRELEVKHRLLEIRSTAERVALLLELLPPLAAEAATRARVHRRARSQREGGTAPRPRHAT